MQSSSYAYAMINMAKDGQCDKGILLDALMLDKLSFLSIDSTNAFPNVEAEDYIVNLLLDAKPIELASVVERLDYRFMRVNTRDIPQFSDINDAFRTVDVVLGAEQPDMTYADIGGYLDRTGERTSGANQKYGENHFKLAQQLGLVSIDSEGKKFVNVLGRGFARLERVEDKMDLAGKLSLRIPFIQYVLLKSRDMAGVRVIDELNSMLSETTARRRRSNIETLSKIIFDLHDVELNTMMRRVDWEALR